MENRYILIPPPVKLPPPNERVKCDFLETMMMNTWTVDPKWGRSVALLMEAADLRRLFADKKPGDWVAIPLPLYEHFLEIVNEPTAPYFPGMMLHALHFFTAITNAPKEPPPVLQPS